MRTEEFKQLYSDLKISYSSEEDEALNAFKERFENLHERLKNANQVEFALCVLDRRCRIESYKRLKMPKAKCFEDYEDTISIIADEDLITFLDLIKKLLIRED